MFQINFALQGMRRNNYYRVNEQISENKEQISENKSRQPIRGRKITFPIICAVVRRRQWGCTWKTKVLEAKAFSAHLRRFFAQGKPLAFGEK
jgi:hypothetical protein